MASALGLASQRPVASRDSDNDKNGEHPWLNCLVCVHARIADDLTIWLKISEGSKDLKGRKAKDFEVQSPKTA